MHLCRDWASGARAVLLCASVWFDKVKLRKSRAPWAPGTLKAKGRQAARTQHRSSWQTHKEFSFSGALTSSDALWNLLQKKEISKTRAHSSAQFIQRKTEEKKREREGWREGERENREKKKMCKREDRERESQNAITASSLIKGIIS